MLSESFKRRIDATNNVEKLEEEIEVMQRIFEQPSEVEIRIEMDEKISYAMKRRRLLRQNLRQPSKLQESSLSGQN